MLGEKAVPVYLVAGVVIVLVIGSTFTPVISRGSGPTASAKAVAIAKQEYAYCRSNLDDVNCACFADIAGQVLSTDTPEFRGTVAADKFELARSQAMQSC